MKTGIELIAIERQEQIEKHGRTLKDSSMVFLTSEHKHGVVGYGFSGGMIWTSEWYAKPITDKLIPATEQEVQSALENEAIKRGLVKGAYAEFGTAKDVREIQTNSYTFCPENNELLNGSDILLSNGLWNKLVQTITRSEAESKLKVRITD